MNFPVRPASILTGQRGDRSLGDSTADSSYEQHRPKRTGRRGKHRHRPSRDLLSTLMTVELEKNGGRKPHC